MFSPNQGVACNEVDSCEETPFVYPPLLKLEQSIAHINVNNSNPLDFPVTSHLKRKGPLTPHSVPNLHLREDFLSSPLFPVNSSSQVLHDPYSLHAASINEEIDRLQKTLSGIGIRYLESKDKFGRTPLMYACIGDRPKSVAILLNAGASLVSTDIFGRNAFHWAAVKGLHECYKIMFKYETKILELHGDGAGRAKDELPWRKKDKSGAIPLHLSTQSSATKCLSFILKHACEEEINCQDSRKRTPLHWAAFAGNFEAVRLLLKSKAKGYVLDENGKPPLFLAVSSLGRKPVTYIKLLLEKWPDALNWQDFEGRYALHLAVADQVYDSEVVDYLMNQCKDWNDMKDKNGQTPLHWAAMLGRTMSVKSLLLCDSAKSTFIENSATPLHYAATFNHHEIIALIVAMDEKLVDLVDSEGRTALIWAANNDCCESIQELVNFGANIEHRDALGYSAFHTASAKGFRGAAKLLLRLGADINAKEKIGNTPLISACKFRQANLVELLRDHGADIEAYNIYLRRAIHVAAGAGFTEILYILIKSGADINIRDILGLTPLHLACQQGCVDCTSLLLARGAKCDVQDEDGRTPLHYAVAKGDENVVRMLLDHSADVNILSCYGETALDICSEIGNQALHDILSKHGAVSSNDMSITATITPKHFLNNFQTVFFTEL